MLRLQSFAHNYFQTILKLYNVVVNHYALQHCEDGMFLNIFEKLYEVLETVLKLKALVEVNKVFGADYQYNFKLVTSLSNLKFLRKYYS